MSPEPEDIYERLAKALEALPHGFPRMKSGVELKLIKMAFEPEEVWLAGQLTRVHETPDAIATRVGRDVVEIAALLERLVPLGLASVNSPIAVGPGIVDSPVVGEKKYRLRQFMVGWYEAGMRRLDKEFAELFEQYVIEGGGERIFAPQPSILGVVPVRGSLKPEYIEREPHLDIDSHFQRHERFLVIPCVCKREEEVLHGHSCSKPMKRCGFVGLPPQTPLGETVVGREEAKALFAKLEKQGHVHLAFYGYTMNADSPQFMGTCNCCPCCCGLFAGRRLTGGTVGAQRSNYRAVIDADACTACGVCITRCPVDAIAEDPQRPVKCGSKLSLETVPGASFVTRDKCIGCGVCVIGCPEDAIVMEPVSEAEWFRTPSSMAEWEEKRLEYLEREKAAQQSATP